ncbi:uncharacterized protein LOC111023927 [Momordica charantia]|uniref:Uncharacterized protein LOC111023927 n=1 Tax=Momordica charantia TaxID=3673 RepID=A0A6J1DS87_MOMCH|nr:uncharacterized protein LOC111023927 [Momordica charantia]
MEFGELKRNFEALKDLVEKQESRVQYHESRAQNITMAYLIWGRLFFFAISQTSSSLLKCIDWWMVLGLSVSCAFVYFLFFLEAVTMLYRVQHQMDIICKEQAEICQQILVARSQLDDVDLAMEAGDSSDGFQFSFHVKLLEYGAFRIVERKFYICATVSALLAVTAIELYACSWLYCDMFG